MKKILCLLAVFIMILPFTFMAVYGESMNVTNLRAEYSSEGYYISPLKEVDPGYKTVYLGHYPVDIAGYGSPSAPIEWYVIGQDEDSLLLMSRYLLAISMTTPAAGETASDWEHSFVRKDLNETFYSRYFSEEERSYIETTKIHDDVSGSDLEDKVFPLSFDELKIFFEGEKKIKNDEYSWYSKEAIATPTVYGASLMGYIEKMDNSSLDTYGYPADMEGVCSYSYMLRDRVDGGKSSMCIGPYGEKRETSDKVGSSSGIRPCIWVSKNTPLVYGKTEGKDPVDPSNVKQPVSPVVVAAASVAAVSAGGAAAYVVVKPKLKFKLKFPKLSRKVIGVVYDPVDLKKDLIKSLAKIPFLVPKKYNINDLVGLTHSMDSDNPDLLILQSSNKEKLEKVFEVLSERGFNKVNVLCRDADTDLEVYLNEKIENKDMVSYAFDYRKKTSFVSLILPAFKNELSAASGLDSVSKIAELLGFNEVSTVISAYLTTKDIKESGINSDTVDSATEVISSIANIMGWTNVEEVSDFINSAAGYGDIAKQEIGRVEILADK